MTMLLPQPQPLPPDQIAAIKTILDDGLANVDSFNKVYVAAFAAAVALVSLTVGSLVQLFIMRRQLKTQRKIASDQQALFMRQLEIQLVANQRLAHDNVAAKRQDWINGLRNDLSLYLATWQEISWRWHAIVDRASEKRESVSGGEIVSKSVKDELPGFESDVSALRLQAHEIVLRIRLRLNPNEGKHNELVGLIESLETNVGRFQRTQSSEPTVVTQERVHRILELIVTKAQTILKEEWNRVKGESGDVKVVAPTPANNPEDSIKKEP